MGAFLGSIGVPPVCIRPPADVGASVCVSLALLPPSPPLPSIVSTSHFIILPVFLRVSIRYLNRDRLVLYMPRILPCPVIVLIFIPFPRLTRVSFARQWRAVDVSIGGSDPDGWKRKRILESRNQDRPVLRTTWLTTLDNVKGILLSNPRYIFLCNVRFRVIYYFSFNIHRVCMQNVYLKLTWNGEDPNSEYFGFIRDLFGGILWRFLILRIVN